MIDFRDPAKQQGRDLPPIEYIQPAQHELAEIRTKLWQRRELGQNSTSTDEDAA
jgi:hypothetical protein